MGGIKASEFTTEQLWYNSKDGTKVPMFVVKHKDTPTDGSAPGIQYGKQPCHDSTYHIVDWFIVQDTAASAFLSDPSSASQC